MVNVFYLFLFIINLVFFFYEKEEHFKNALKHFLLKYKYIKRNVYTVRCFNATRKHDTVLL